MSELTDEQIEARLYELQAEKDRIREEMLALKIIQSERAAQARESTTGPVVIVNGATAEGGLGGS